MDLETALTSLYQATRDEFIPARADLVKQARSAGDRELAGKIAAARKPTVAAWLLNRVGHEYPDDLDTLAALSGALRGAHQQLAADQLRALSKERNDLLRTLDDRALRIARRAGMTVTDQVADQLREAFTAALLAPDVLATLRTGRLSAVPGADASTGWPTWDGIPAAARPAPTRTPAPAPRPAPQPKSTKELRSGAGRNGARRDEPRPRRKPNSPRPRAPRPNRRSTPPNNAPSRPTTSWPPRATESNRRGSSSARPNRPCSPPNTTTTRPNATRGPPSAPSPTFADPRTVRNLPTVEISWPVSTVELCRFCPLP